MSDYKNPLPNETYLNVIPLSDGGMLINDVTYSFHSEGYLSYWDVKYYELERSKYTPVRGKNHTYFVYGCNDELCKPVAIAYHKKLGKHEVWKLD